MSDIEAISVEVVYALPDKQQLIRLLVEPGTTALQAAQKAGLEQFFADLELENMPMGLFGQSFGTKGLAKAESYTLKEGDRVEIYRPLTADPKEVRRRRAQKAKEAEDKASDENTASEYKS